MRRLQRWVIAMGLCGCGPAVAVGEADTSGTDASSTAPATQSAGTMMPPQSEGASLDDASVDTGPIWEDGQFPDWDVASTTGPSCPQMFEVLPLPSVVAVLVDDSQSMATRTIDHDLDPETAEITRWNLVADALAVHVPELVELGMVELVAFPSSGAEAPPLVTACENLGPYAQFDDDADALLAGLPAADATYFQGATPMAGAIAEAAFDLSGFGDQLRRSIVVVTDGAANCALASEPPALFDDVDFAATSNATMALAQGISTHVIGVGVPEGDIAGGPEGDAIGDHREALRAVAEAGGSDARFVEDVDALDLAMRAIEREVHGCRLAVPSEIAGGWYHVEIDGVYYGDELGSGNCADNAGFHRLTLPGGEVLEMCGEACDALREHGSAIIVEMCVFPE